MFLPKFFTPSVTHNISNILNNTSCGLLFKTNKIIHRQLTSQIDSSDSNNEQKVGFAKAFDNQETLRNEMLGKDIWQKTAPQSKSFASMLRHSTFVGLGDFQRIVAAKVIEVQDDNLFIDYGGKFHCVCNKPRENADQFVRGTRVIIQLHDWELAARFMGATRDITLLESDATLLDLDNQYGRIGKSKDYLENPLKMIDDYDE